jgi:GTP-binding protein HflX
MDRTMVILEIFHRNARSRAAKAQVEIARLGYMAPRLREAAKLAGPQGRQRSGVGGRGAGESHTELDKRKIRDRIAELQLEITAMEAERKTQRARRQERKGLAGVALVGYTNAGKSTLMRALTGSEVLVANKLFATLDTTVRALYPESAARPGGLVQIDAGRSAGCLAAAARDRRQRPRFCAPAGSDRQGAGGNRG